MRPQAPSRPGRLEPHGEGCPFQVQGPAAGHADGARHRARARVGIPLLLAGGVPTGARGVTGVLQPAPIDDESAGIRLVKAEVEHKACGRLGGGGGPSRGRGQPRPQTRSLLWSSTVRRVSWRFLPLGPGCSANESGHHRAQGLGISPRLARLDGGLEDGSKTMTLNSSAGTRCRHKKACIRSSAGTLCRTSSRP